MVPLVLFMRTSVRKNCLMCCHLVFSREDLESLEIAQSFLCLFLTVNVFLFLLLFSKVSISLI